MLEAIRKMLIGRGMEEELAAGPGSDLEQEQESSESARPVNAGKQEEGKRVSSNNNKGGKQEDSYDNLEINASDITPETMATIQAILAADEREQSEEGGGKTEYNWSQKEQLGFTEDAERVALHDTGKTERIIQNIAEFAKEHADVIEQGINLISMIPATSAAIKSAQIGTKIAQGAKAAKNFYDRTTKGVEKFDAASSKPGKVIEATSVQPGQPGKVVDGYSGKTPESTHSSSSSTPKPAPAHVSTTSTQIQPGQGEVIKTEVDNSGQVVKIQESLTKLDNPEVTTAESIVSKHTIPTKFGTQECVDHTTSVVKSDIDAKGKSYLRNTEFLGIMESWPAAKIAAEKIPAEMGIAKYATKENTTGLKWIKGHDNIRISQAKPSADWECQRVDYVHVSSKGQVLDAKGNYIKLDNNTKQLYNEDRVTGRRTYYDQSHLLPEKRIQDPANHPDAHIDFEIWKNWKYWNKPK